MKQSPSLEAEIALISAYKVPLLGISRNFSEFGAGDRESYIADLSHRYNVAVVAPFSGGLDPNVDTVATLVTKRQGLV